MGHGRAAGRHAILQVIGNDRRDIVRGDRNSLNKRCSIAKVIVGDPGANDGSAGAELSVVGLRQGDGEVGIVIVTIVGRFDIGRGRNIGGAGNGDIMWKR